MWSLFFSNLRYDAK
ncbi:hypothetical protein, partial [Streptomyces sp. NPDC056237]